MPATHSSRIPSYRLHKPTGQAVVTLDGKDLYLGRHGSPESRVEYHRLIGEWEANGRRRSALDAAGSDLTINEMLIAYLKFADSYYVKNGKPTTEPHCIALSMRPLRRLYGHTLAKDLGPLSLKTVRQVWIVERLGFLSLTQIEPAAPSPRAAVSGHRFETNGPTIHDGNGDSGRHPIACVVPLSPTG